MPIYATSIRNKHIPVRLNCTVKQTLHEVKFPSHSTTNTAHIFIAVLTIFIEPCNAFRCSTLVIGPILSFFRPQFSRWPCRVDEIYPVDPTTTGIISYVYCWYSLCNLDARMKYLSHLSFSSLETFTSMGTQMSIILHILFSNSHRTISGLLHSTGGWTLIFLSHHISILSVLNVDSGVFLSS